MFNNRAMDNFGTFDPAVTDLAIREQGRREERRRIRRELLRLRGRMEDVEMRDRLPLFISEIDRICPEEQP